MCRGGGFWANYTEAINETLPYIQQMHFRKKHNVTRYKGLPAALAGRAWGRQPGDVLILLTELIKRM